jgi:hypothetical protein
MFHRMTSGLIRVSTLCLAAALAAGCVGIDEAEELDEDLEITSVSQAIGTVLPAQDPQACALPDGRYVVLATPTTQANAYNVTFLSDAAAGSNPSLLCKTMTFVWNEGTAPVPPTPPAEDQFHTMLFEGWWATATTKRFAVKAAWKTVNNQGVATQVNTVPAFGYAIISDDFGIPYNQRFNWIGAGSDANRSYLVNNTIGQGPNYTVAIAGDGTNVVQTLYLHSGSSRIHLAGIATRPCTSGYVCPPAAP